MRFSRTTVLLLFFSGLCFADGTKWLRPKHIEKPVYPPIARTAHITGQVSLTLTVDESGRVEDVKAHTEPDRAPGSKILQDSAVKTVRQWTFHKPPRVPYTETVVFDYRMDNVKIDRVKVIYDSPLHVTILGPLPFVEP